MGSERICDWIAFGYPKDRALQSALFHQENWRYPPVLRPFIPEFLHFDLLCLDGGLLFHPSTSDKGVVDSFPNWARRLFSLSAYALLSKGWFDFSVLGSLRLLRLIK